MAARSHWPLLYPARAGPLAKRRCQRSQWSTVDSGVASVRLQAARGILFLVPAYPHPPLSANSAGNLALLLNSPMSATSIYFGRIGRRHRLRHAVVDHGPPGGRAFSPRRAPISGGVGLLYAVLGLAVLQLTTLGLLVSSVPESVDSSLRLTYALVLAVAVLPLVPHALLEGKGGEVGELTSWLRCLSPIPAVLEVIGQGGQGAHGMDAGGSVIGRYALLAILSSLACALATISRLSSVPLDRSRPAGVMTNDLSLGTRAARRMFFIVDPNRRSRNISLLVNPIMVKEFRTRRFGRSHWTLRLIALSALLSLGLSCVAASGALDWVTKKLPAASSSFRRFSCCSSRRVFRPD